jgi:hypothetical protein
MPSIPSAPPPMIPPRPASEAKSAFFKVVSAPVAIARQAPADTPPQPGRTQAGTPSAPDRVMRPGSIIDIKV